MQLWFTEKQQKPDDFCAIYEIYFYLNMSSCTIGKHFYLIFPIYYL